VVRPLYKRVAVVGGGVAGLTAALRLAEHGHKVDLYEAAPALGGRAKSFFDEGTQTWVDNGPHLMVGAYAATKQLLADVGASQHVTWQPNLCLPLWDKKRRFFSLQVVSWLPISLGLLLAVFRLPQHRWSSVKAMLKLALSMKSRNEQQTVAAWYEEVGAPDILIQDMLDVLCLGVMNESSQTANAKTFARVLATSFSSHSNARMGWFNKPLSQAFIEPVAAKAEALGVKIHLRHSIRDLASLDHDAVVLAMPAYARNRLLGIQEKVATQAITNVHFWFEEKIEMASPMIGSLGTYGQWLFDVSAMLGEQGLQHVCITISADMDGLAQDECVQLLLKEMQEILQKPLLEPKHVRFVREKRATVLVRNHARPLLPEHIFDACESPTAGQLPATIELAVISGIKIAELRHMSLEIKT